jgi:hypothetical protein
MAQPRTIAAKDFFVGPMITTPPSSACLVFVRFPIWRDARIGIGFDEINARKSDFAFASAAAQIALDNDGICQNWHWASVQSPRFRRGSMR